MRLVAAALIVVSGVTLWGSAAMAHSEVRQRAPEAGQVVGGTVTHVDISFWVPVAEGTTSLTGPDGDPIPVGETTLSPNGLVTSVEFDALVEPGSYVVEHTELANDGDIQTQQFGFVYQPDAEGRVASLIERSTGPNWPLLLGIVLIVGGLAGFFAPWRRN